MNERVPPDNEPGNARHLPEPSPSRAGDPYRGRTTSQLRGRLYRLTLKELREILRDRRTIITLVLMPLLVYPVLGVVFQKFVLTLPRRNSQFWVGVESRRDEQLLAQFFSPANEHLQALRKQHAWPLGTPGETPPRYEVIGTSDQSLEDLISEGAYDLGLRSHPLPSVMLGGQVFPRVEIELIYQPDSVASLAAAEYLQDRLAAWEDLIRLEFRFPAEVLGGVVATTGLTVDRLQQRIVQTRFVNVANNTTTTAGVSLASVIPLILILMTITGAVYPAIDLTAGERERGTLEALVAAPLPRMALLFGKYVAVVTVALMTALVNLIAMTVTVRTVGLSMALFGPGGLSVGTIAAVFALLVLFAIFFSAVLLAVTSFARSFKEAQAYLIPLMLLSLAPGVMSLVPGVSLAGPLAVVPLINIVLLARDVFAGNADPAYATVAVLSTGLYCAATLALAARIFGTDAILYGSQGTWTELVQRPREPSARATLPMAMFCLAALFPLFFMAGGVLRGDGTYSVSRQMAISAILTAVLFGGLPLSLALWRRLHLPTAFAFQPAAWLAYAGAILLGLTLWPAAHEAVWLSKIVGLATLDTEALAGFESSINTWASVPTWLMLVTLAIAPAVFEEICFRGFILQALLGRLAPWMAIFTSALLFGVFHVLVNGVLMTERLIPSTFLGVVLGWVAWRSGSILPGMALHVCHNGLVTCTLLYQQGRFGRIPALETTMEWLGLKSQALDRAVTHLPLPSLLLGILGPALAIWLLSRLPTAGEKLHDRNHG